MKFLRSHLLRRACLTSVCLTAPIWGCATSPSPQKASGAVVSDVNSAEGMYQRANRRLDKGQITEAQEAFNALKAAHPYSRFSALCDLRLADSHLKRSEWLEAIDMYRSFLRFHPTHPEAGYASFQIGEAQMAQIPRNWFFLVSSVEKDQDSTRAAIDAFESFLKQETEGPRVARAHAQLGVCKRRLAEHEMYVARFYAKRKHPEGAWRRAEAVLETYPNVGLEPEALFIAGKARLAGHCADAGKHHLVRLVEQYPTSRFVKLARPLLNAQDASGQ